ncbi:hypothetical protein CMQ_5063 [Grosmannia clavigera kw1407]|uniref:Uncharacterized protein n=1 Tax=Grosmannia clavigera (strain kw1407 / UAMH 11150) TaxID=655863 RepID=F0XKB6_GROCL|nr:uncharacterized protein CMQ_5063 [Grosmannia clavigera kw1407]EFX01992.1 hypothetical protein CMQ_5063 [Grosmannia clavigera kw1407]
MQPPAGIRELNAGSTGNLYVVRMAPYLAVMPFALNYWMVILPFMLVFFIASFFVCTSPTPCSVLVMGNRRGIEKYMTGRHGFNTPPLALRNTKHSQQHTYTHPSNSVVHTKQLVMMPTSSTQNSTTTVLGQVHQLAHPSIGQVQ